jgi:hypothetical protein
MSCNLALHRRIFDVAYKISSEIKARVNLRDTLPVNKELSRPVASIQTGKRKWSLKEAGIEETEDVVLNKIIKLPTPKVFSESIQDKI